MIYGYYDSYEQSERKKTEEELLDEYLLEQYEYEKNNEILEL